jgi:hypothetical protein
MGVTSGRLHCEYLISFPVEGFTVNDNDSSFGEGLQMCMAVGGVG